MSDEIFERIMREAKEAAQRSKHIHGLIQGRPSNQVVLERFRTMANQRGHPYFLPFSQALLGDENGHVSGNPAGCIGPRERDRSTKRKYPCNRVNLCCYCWERKVREGGLRAARTHIAGEHVYKISTTLPAVKNDLDAIKEARKKLWQRLEKAGFTRRTLWIHTFGDNPAQGVKGHIDGIISGPVDADVDVLSDDGHELHNTLRPYTTSPIAHWTPYVHSRAILGQSPKLLAKSLVLAGFYSGRPTFPTRKVYAGLHYKDNQYRVRLTNVNRKTKHHSEIEDLEINGTTQRDWSQDETMQALRAAQAWRPRISATPYERLRQAHVDAVLGETSWRKRYRLESRRQFEDKHS